MSYHKQRLNDYERWYFKKFFKTNVKRLLAFRKKLKNYIDYNKITFGENAGPTKFKFKTKGDVEHEINISRKSIDLYLDLIGYDCNGNKKVKQ